MPTATLPNRSVIRLSGAGTKPWLNNLISANVETIAPNDVRLGALLAPQGKILFDFMMTLDPEDPEALYLDASATITADLIKRLTLYRLRAPIRFEPVDGLAVVAAWGGAAPAHQRAGGADLRADGLGQRLLIPADQAPQADAEAYAAHRLSLGVPEGGADFAFGDAFPHEALMDMLGGVDFKKGCYVGQEVVSRMQHRGTARTRLTPVTAPALPLPGAEVMIGDKLAGRMASSAGSNGLAMLRLDRVDEGFAAGAALTAAGAALTLARPPWWTAFWPQAISA